jgi:hypothetical protein
VQHVTAVQGWCPPVSLFRRLGFRTQREIDEERFALKALLGHFQQVPARAERSGLQALQAARQ